MVGRFSCWKCLNFLFFFQGYSIFVVKGNLQPCEADQYLIHSPVSKEDFLKSKQQSASVAKTKEQVDSEQSSGMLPFISHSYLQILLKITSHYGEELFYGEGFFLSSMLHFIFLLSISYFSSCKNCRPRRSQKETNAIFWSVS